MGPIPFCHRKLWFVFQQTDRIKKKQNSAKKNNAKLTNKKKGKNKKVLGTVPSSRAWKVRAPKISKSYFFQFDSGRG